MSQTEPQRRRFSIGFVSLLLVLGVAMFWFPSAWAASRGAPWWLCLTVGALAFPVLPAVWQVVAERRRRTKLAALKTQRTSVLTGGDRFVMRCLVVAIVAIGPAFAIDGKSAIRNAWDNVAWIIPPTPFPGHAESALLARVPAEAEIVMSIHKEAERGDASSKAVDAVVAYGNHKLMIYGTGEDGGRDLTDRQLEDELAKLPVKIDKVTQYTKSPTYIASESWKSALDAATGPSAELKTLLAKAPSTATAVIAMTPKSTEQLKQVKTAVGWLTMSHDTLDLDATLEATDALSATAMEALVRGWWKAQRDKMPDTCKEPVDKIVDKLHFDQSGATLHASLKVPAEELGAVMLCGLKL